MSKHLLTFLLVLHILFFPKTVDCGCGCGCDNPCNDPSAFGQGRSLGELGIKLCEEGVPPPLEMHKPICPPPPTICKELGIESVPPFYPPPPLPGCGGGWLPLLPRCLRKRIRYPFCLKAANLATHQLALSKLRLSQPGFNIGPLSAPGFGRGCGCGCGR